ncbi:hypothetical protein [Xanthomonas phaseoli]
MLPDSLASAEDCWAGTLEIFCRTPSESVIGILAAGP